VFDFLSRNKKRPREEEDDDEDIDDEDGPTFFDALFAGGVDPPHRDPKTRRGGNNKRTQQEIWDERCNRVTIAAQKTRGCLSHCSCGKKCIENMGIGHVFECRVLNADRSSAQIRDQARRKLDFCYSRERGTTTFQTEGGTECCRAAFAFEQGFEPSFISRLLKDVKGGVVLDAERGGE
jgi:hypothetical protein